MSQVAVPSGAFPGLRGHRVTVPHAVSYTLALTDSDTFQRTTDASAQTVTVPPASSVAFDTDTEIDFYQAGAGQLTFAAGSGVTINSKGGKLNLTGQFSGATLKYHGSDVWDLVGDLA